MSAIKKQDITINQGTTFKMDVECLGVQDEVISLTGYTARAHIRQGYADFYADAYPFIVNITPITGTISLTMSASTTQGLDFSKGLWDLELINPDGEVVRLLEGTVRISKEVTR